MELNEFEIYKGKSFAALCKEIVVNQNEKKDQLDVLISELRSLIKGVNDAIVIVPLIRDYLDVGVKNDDQLVKLAAIIQRIISKQNEESAAGANGFSITDDERKQLMEEVEKLQASNSKSTSVQVKEIK
jgi:molybdopterin converting factor small subunit